MNTPSSDKNENSFPELPANQNFPENIDRRTFLIRNAVIGAAAAMTGTVWTLEARAAQAAKEATQKSPLPPLDSTSMEGDERDPGAFGTGGRSRSAISPKPSHNERRPND